jgi:SpoVK/Ycf46/Vps4 family AAA+-type ATPase
MSVSPSIINAIKQALAANPNDISLMLHLAHLLVQAEQYQEAITQFMAILSIDPTHVEALESIIQWVDRLDNIELLEQCQDYRQLALLLQQANELVRSLTQFHEQLVNTPLAVELLQRVLQREQTLANETRANDYVRLLMALGVQPLEDKNSSPITDDKVVPIKPTNPPKLHVVENHSASSEELWEIESATITLKEVGGMAVVKRRLELAFLSPLKHPEMLQAYGKNLRGGLLLYGPPGCGKTFIARALAGELQAKFMAVGFHEILDMYIGESERKLHDIFESARRNRPIVLFFDELDAVGQKRSQQANSSYRKISSQLLIELDSVTADNTNVFVLGATNHPWDVDSALRRPGRFDRTLLVLPPDEPARRAILNYHLKTRPAKSIDIAWLAAQTQEFSGADLAHLCDSAVEYAIEDSLHSGKVTPLTHAHFKRVLKEIRSTTRVWFESARNYAMFANQHGEYDDLLAYLKANKW